MQPYLRESPRKSLLLRLGIRIAERKTGRRLEAPRVLAWYPKAALGAGVLEALVAHDEGRATRRLLKLVRMQVSMAASCAFCVDMNSREFADAGVSEAEVVALRDGAEPGAVPTFSAAERAALRYARSLTATPIRLDPAVLEDMLAAFDEREFVVVASTVAQVNFWTRLIQGLGVPPAGFSASCAVLDLDRYATLGT